MAKRTFNLLPIEAFEQYIATIPVKRAITNVQIHHTYRPNIASYGSATDKQAVIYGMWDYHVNSRGFRDIAQHFTVAPDGIWDGRSLDMDSGGFLGSENIGGICFEMIGDFDLGHEQFAGPIAENAYRAIAACIKRWPKADIRFHRDQPSAHSKTCPGTGILKQAFVAAVNLRLQPKSYSAIIAERTGIGVSGWTENESKYPAYKSLAKVVADNWNELDKVPWMGEWFKKVGEKLGN